MFITVVQSVPECPDEDLELVHVHLNGPVSVAEDLGDDPAEHGGLAVGSSGVQDGGASLGGIWTVL